MGGKGRKLPGTLEAHANGFRYSNPKNEVRRMGRMETYGDAWGAWNAASSFSTITEVDIGSALPYAPDRIASRA